MRSKIWKISPELIFASCVQQLHRYIIKTKIHSSCEIEDFVETHLCKLCVIDAPITRVTGCASSLRIQVGDSPWNYSVACTRVNRVMLVSLCA